MAAIAPKVSILMAMRTMEPIWEGTAALFQKPSFKPPMKLSPGAS